MTPVTAPSDPNSAANFGEFYTDHLSLVWNVDFSRRVIQGNAKLHMRRVSPGSSGKAVKLDGVGLAIKSVKYNSKEPLKYAVQKGRFGDVISVDLADPAAPSFVLDVEYETTEKCTAVQWLTPEQTSGKKHPYLFTQCQDTPAVKSTYEAVVSVPAPLTAVMSANKRSKSPASADRNVLSFRQTTAIPAYLIALGVGDLHSVDIGPRSTLWSEKEALKAAAWEFADTEAFISTAESLEHFWLNEGFTMFLERKILGRLHGEKHRHLDAIVGLGSLRDSIAQFPPGSPATRLVADLADTDPDDVFSTVPYEKGHTLLAYIEEQVGGAEKFEPYLAAHIRHFAGKSITTDEWKAFLLSFFPKLSLDWDVWLYGTGMPPVVPKYDDTLVRPCKALAAECLAGPVDGGDKRTARAYETLSVQQKLVFLDTLIDCKDRLTLAHLRAIDAACALSSSRNVEICLKWYMLSLSLKDASCLPAVQAYVTAHGRMKYNRPLYRLMAAMGPKEEALARETFAQHRAFYHPIAAQMICKDLKVAP